jgi:chromosome segregation ATPase
MADIQYWDDALTQEIENIQQLLEEMEGYDDEEKMAELSIIEKELRKANATKRSLKMETRLVADVGQRRQYENRLARLEEELGNLQADVRAAKDGVQRSALLKGSAANNNCDDSMAEFTNTEDAVRAGDDMLNKAAGLQDKTQESLDYTKNMVAESKEVGASTLTELQRQREVIERIDFEADRINDNLNRAEQLVKQFGKRMASDKFIQCFAVINVLMLVGVILYAVFGKGTTLGQPHGAPPPNPVGGTRMLRGLIQQQAHALKK